MSIKNKALELKNIISQQGIFGGLRAIQNRLRWEYYRQFTDRDHMPISIFNCKMYTQLYNPGISSTIAMWGIREPASVSLVDAELTEGDIVVDIGANIGYYTLLMSSIIGSSGTIYAIEPHPETYNSLEKNVYANDLKSTVNLYNLAISDIKGTVELLVDSRNNLNRVNDLIERDYEDQIAVDAKSLDSLLSDERNIDFMRMDIEGYEEVVLSNRCSGEIISEHKPTILFEAHPNYSEMNSTLEFLFDHGYTPSTVVTTTVCPDELIKFGYKPDDTIQDQGRELGVYNHISQEHLQILLSTEKPHVVRDVLLK